MPVPLSRMPKRALVLALLSLLLASAASAAPATFESLVSDGRLALDTGSLDTASTYFEKAASLYPARAAQVAPDRAWLYVRLGNAAVAAQNYERAEYLFSLSEAIYPDFGEVYKPQWAFARIALTNKNLEAASENPRDADWESLKRDAQTLLRMAPGNTQALFMLGLIEEALGKGDAAREQYLAVIGGRPANQSLDNLRDAAHAKVTGVRVAFDLRPVCPLWRKSDRGRPKELRYGPFVIQHNNDDLAERVARVLEFHLTRPILDGVLGPEDPFPQECNVRIFPDESAFQASGGKEVWAGGQSRFTLANGKLKSATIQLYQTAPELMESAIPHELAHVRLVASAHFYEGLPLWLLEGVATAAESDYSKSVKARILAEAIENRSILPVKDVLLATAYPSGGASDVYYAETLAIVESLVERYGADRFSRFVAALENTEQTRALQQVYSLTPAQVEDFVIDWTAARR